MRWEFASTVCAIRLHVVWELVAGVTPACEKKCSRQDVDLSLHVYLDWMARSLVRNVNTSGTAKETPNYALHFLLLNAIRDSSKFYAQITAALA